MIQEKATLTDTGFNIFFRLSMLFIVDYFVFMFIIKVGRRQNDSVGARGRKCSNRI